VIKVITKQDKKDRISVYISVKDKVLLNELKNVCKKKHLTVVTNHRKNAKYDYIVTNNENEKSHVFTDITSSVLITKQKSRKFLKKLVKKNIFNKIIIYNRDLVGNDNSNIFSRKILNELLSSTNKKNQIVNLTISSDTHRSIISKLNKAIFATIFIAAFHFVSTMALVGVSGKKIASYVKMDSRKCDGVKTIYKTGSLPTILLKKLFPENYLIGDFTAIFEIKRQIIEKRCEIANINNEITTALNCLQQKCADNAGLKIQNFQTIELYKKNIRNSSLSKIYNRDYDFWQSSQVINNKYFDFFNIVGRVLGSDTPVSILVVNHNPKIPTRNGGVVNKITLFSVSRFNIVEEISLSVEEFAKYSKNNQEYQKILEKYPFSDEKISISFVENDIEVTSQILKNINDFQVDIVVHINSDKPIVFSEGNDLLERITHLLVNKDLQIVMTETELRKNFESVLGQKRNCSKDKLQIIETSYSGVELESVRDVSLKSTVRKNHLEHIVVYEVGSQTQGFNDFVNIEILLPIDVKNFETKPDYWRERLIGNSRSYDVQLGLFQSPIIEISYITPISSVFCSDKYDFSFITQPGLLYDFEYNIESKDTEFYILDKNSLTSRSLQRYNTTLLKQAADMQIDFQFGRK
jgi:hypothetical protein